MGFGVEAREYVHQPPRCLQGGEEMFLHLLGSGCEAPGMFGVEGCRGERRSPSAATIRREPSGLTVGMGACTWR